MDSQMFGGKTVAELRELDAKRTQGEWVAFYQKTHEACGHPWIVESRGLIERFICELPVDEGVSRHEGPAIVAAVNALGPLLDEVERLRAELAALRKRCEDAVKLLERSRSALQFFGANCGNDLLRQKAYREVKDIDDFLAERLATRTAERDRSEADAREWCIGIVEDVWCDEAYGTLRLAMDEIIRRIRAGRDAKENEVQRGE